MGSTVVLGAGGHAKEVLDSLMELGSTENVYFFDNTVGASNRFLGEFEVITDEENLTLCSYFYLGIGDVELRRKLSRIAVSFGLKRKGLRSANTQVGQFNVAIAPTVDIMLNVTISSCVSIEEGTLLNRGVSIHHDVSIGANCVIGPRAVILGGAEVGDDTFIGTGATVLPKMKIGESVVIGAGAVITKDIPSNAVVMGVPGQITGYK